MKSLCVICMVVHGAKMKKDNNNINNPDKLNKNKKAQVVTLDLIIGVCIFLITIVLIFYMFSMDVADTEEEDAADDVIASLSGNDYFEDGEIDSDELDAMLAMDCTELKAFFNTNKNICIYVTDKGGNLVTLDVQTAFGCGGIKIDDTICGETS
jgi:hypothetical protein